MRMASIFKEFVTTYNRTYESKEGEDPDLAVSVPIRSGPSPPLGTLVLERGRPLLSSDFLGQRAWVFIILDRMGWGKGQIFSAGASTSLAW